MRPAGRPRPRGWTPGRAPLGGADVHRGPCVVAAVDRLARLVEGGRGERQPVPGLFEVLCGGGGGRFGVPLPHRAEGRPGAGDALRQGAVGGLGGGHGLRGGLFEGAQPVEVLGHGVQALVGVPAPADDLVEHAAPCRVVLGEGVVQLLPQPERGGQLGPGVLDGPGERGRGLLAELGRGEAELLLAGPYGVVRVDQVLLGPCVQVRQGDLRLGRRSGPAAPAARRRGRTGARTASAAGEGEGGDGDRHHDQGQGEDQAYRGATRAVPGVRGARGERRGRDGVAA